MSEWPHGGLEGFTVEDNGDGSVTVHRDGSSTTKDPAFIAWWSDVSVVYPEVDRLIRAWSEGRRGRGGEYRPVTVSTVRFNPATLVASRVWLGPADNGDAQTNSDWS